MSRLAFLLLLSLLLTGCIPPAVTRTASMALPPHEVATTRLGEWALDEAAARQGRSGFRLLPRGGEAFAVRAALLDQAERTLDVQSYIADDGITSRVLMQRALQAAERGVRVRLLLDDLASLGSEAYLAALDSHPGVEVRLFNPLLRGRGNLLTRGLMMGVDFDRQHRRMHNKLWVVDNAVAITGGRNLGDEYFDADEQRNFADLDVLAAGPIVGDLSASFDSFWRHPLAQPLARFATAEPGAWRTLREELEAWLAAQREDNPYFLALKQRYAESPERFLVGHLTWAHGEALWDDPGKVRQAGRPSLDQTLAGELLARRHALEGRLLLISAYFVPTRAGVEGLVELAEAGVETTVITNSLAATDIPAVHGAYARYRPALLEQGVRLFELRPDGEDGASLGLPGASDSSLHIKAMAFDTDRLFVGSFNIDPRSLWWNTEVGLLIESPELNAELWALAELGMSPALSFEVRQADDGGLSWHAMNGDHPQVWRREPAGIWRRLGAWLGRLPGMESLL
ncbi:phospholipase D family protein [Halomonas sp. 328]|uniref:phospholipase D family protein n=1 Tax=Halomonas sp. 328 TaxID=2776704 RepID=UPI0018A71C50|nr:phospholipase D family protein [Halomonas sp. 328]MBF8223544.1 phospholipase D family protein [Halomonas sp. 328]